MLWHGSVRCGHAWKALSGSICIFFPCSQMLSIGCIRITKCEKFTADHCCQRTSSQGHMYCQVTSHIDLGDPFQDILISNVTWCEQYERNALNRWASRDRAYFDFCCCLMGTNRIHLNTWIRFRKRRLSLWPGPLFVCWKGSYDCVKMLLCLHLRFRWSMVHC